MSPLTKNNENKKFEELEEVSYLVIGGGEAIKEEDYVNYQSECSKSKYIAKGTEKNCCISPLIDGRMRSDKPETSSNSTTFTVATSASLSSSYTTSSVAPICSVRMDCDLKSPCSLHDSTISRLIDAVSLNHEQDSCGSISALIGQFETTDNQNHISALSHDTPPSHTVTFKPAMPRALEDIGSPVNTKTSSPYRKLLTSPQKIVQKSNHVNSEICLVEKISQAGTAPALMSSPETTEVEDVYTILDEEVLLPVSVYNLKKQALHVQADTSKSTPSSSLGSSPAKAIQGIGKGHSVGWNNADRNTDMSVDIEEPEERVYEEVTDPPSILSEMEQSTSKRYLSSSSNNKCLQILHHSAGEAFREVELNVDEDPLDLMLTSSRHDNHWDGLLSPSKRHAIYQNHESPPSYSQQQKPTSSYAQVQYSTHSSLAAFTQSPTVNHLSHQLSNHHRQQDHSQAHLCQRYIMSGTSNPAPLHQNSYPKSQRTPEALNNSRDLNIPFTQQRSYSGSHILHRRNQDRPGYKEIDSEQMGCFYNGFSPLEIPPGQSSVSVNISRDRGLYSPSSECEAVYNHPDYDCFMPQSSAFKDIQPHTRSQEKMYGLKQSGKHKAPLINSKQHPQVESKASLHSNVGSLGAPLQFISTSPPASSPCKSKSLGDLTSEDISCNFQGKYHIISRSFVTPHLRKQKPVGAAGEATFRSQSCDPLTEQLRRLVSLEGDERDGESLQSPQSRQEAKSQLSQQQAANISPAVPRDIDDSPPVLTRRLSSRSQSRVRHINSRARERQQDALKPRPGVVINSTSSIGGVVLRNKPASQNPPVNRHSTGSYIAGYLGDLEDRGLPEGACSSLHYTNGDSYGDRYYTDDSLLPTSPSHSASEPEVYFLLRL